MKKSHVTGLQTVPNALESQLYLQTTALLYKGEKVRHSLQDILI